MKKNDPRKISKKKAEKREKALLRDSKIQGLQKEVRQAFHYQELNKKKYEPIVRKGPFDTDIEQVLGERKMSREEAIAKINHNLDILRALEEEYDREQAERDKNNEQMESEGITDLSKKVEELQRRSSFTPQV